ncbi:MAG: sugar ABC transporter permease [Propionibacteriaceae bacterium]|jgi:putative multiple sugar transport system permease protein|nr:sugar ABC transporter permease [Propionibacteriaceae bacterium]
MSTPTVLDDLNSAPVAASQPMGRFLLDSLRKNGILLAFVLVVIVFAILQPALLSPSNLTNLVLQYAYVLILALGMLMVIVLAQIDLSVGSVVALTGAVAALVCVRGGMPWWLGVLAALAVGILCGVWQGFWVAFVGIPGFIVSLGGMLIFRGLAQLLLNYQSLSPFGGTYYDISNGFLNGLFGGNGYDVFTLVIFAIAVVGFAVAAWRSRAAKLRYQQKVSPLPVFIVQIVVVAAIAMAYAWQISHNRGLPVILIILAVFIMIYGVVMGRTGFGRHIYAIGGNLMAAQLSGVKVKKVTFLAFVNMGFLAAVAGVVYSARMNAAQPAAGNSFELDAIAACFIGGASTTGGIGRIGGAVIGGLIMAVISNGMQLMGVSQGIQPVVKGLILTLAVAFDLWNRRRSAVAA